MAFGLPDSDAGTGDRKFLGRIQFDARNGDWKIVKRAQREDGSHYDDVGDEFKATASSPLSLLIDLGSLEIGFIKLTGGNPDFRMVPMGAPLPPQPLEMTEASGVNKAKKAYSSGFRVQVASQRTFGTLDSFYFSSSSKGVLAALENLWFSFQAAPEARTGKVPVVQVAGTLKTEVKTPQGKNTFHAPAFQIVSWADRVEAFGERTVPVPSGAAPEPVARPTASAQPPANHAPPPSAPVAPAPAPTGMPQFQAPVAPMPIGGDSIPF